LMEKKLIAIYLFSNLEFLKIISGNFAAALQIITTNNARNDKTFSVFTKNIT